MASVEEAKIRDLQNLVIWHKRRVWKPYMVKYGCQVIAELGVHRGDNFRLMIEHAPKLAVAVDSWLDDGAVSRNDAAQTQADFDNNYEYFKKEMAGLPFVKICRGYTFDVVKTIADELFDLIYIDADHTYEGCLRDIEDWWPKLKSGGTMVGDDYRVATLKKTGVKFGVIEAVGTFVKRNNLKFFELSRYMWAIIKP